jgi:UDP-N-acetylmuramoylalanine--D-glutamate ligase
MIILRKYQDRKVGVVGLGKSGLATVSALLAGSAEVVAWDDSETSRAAFSRQFMEGKARLLDPAQWVWKELEMLVLSPGVPLTHPQPHPTVIRAKEAGVRVVGDIELLCEAYPLARKIAVTGTNGKSTTTALIGHIIAAAGGKPEVGGNLGTPALSLAPVGNDGCYVLELSSYQLDLLHSTRFNIAMLLNITPDHIDRHGSMAGYVEAKSHIFDRQTKQDAALVGIDDDYSRSVYAALKQTSKTRLMGISATHELKQGVYVDKEGILHDKLNPDQPAFVDLHGVVSLTGRHNWQNAAFAYAACKLHGLAPSVIERGLRSFPGLRHRLQIVCTIHGVRFINDSKATNADATSNALAPFNNIYWIAGGKPKEGGIASLQPYFSHIAHAFLIGEAEAGFAHTLGGQVPFTRSGTLANAFNAAMEMAFADRKQGAVVMLSPACASFDQWKSFEERGDAFCMMAERLLDGIVKGKRSKTDAF